MKEKIKHGSKKESKRHSKLTDRGTRRENIRATKNRAADQERKKAGSVWKKT
jgi:hypothetical protein